MKVHSRTGLLIAVSTATIVALVAKRSLAENVPLQTVASVDIKRYVGKWYEIARYPNRFQRKCLGDTTAVYSLREDGKIEVVNSCRQEGKTNVAKGTARVVDAKTQAKLKVTFFWPFSGDYWIIGLGRNYEYAVVAEPSRKYLWILSRTPQMSPALYDEALQTIRQAGYDTARLMKTPQTSASSADTGAQAGD